MGRFRQSKGLDIPALGIWAIIGIGILTVFQAVFGYIRERERLRDQVMDTAVILARGLNKSNLQAIAAVDNPQAMPQYARMQRQLDAMFQLYPRLDWLEVAVLSADSSHYESFFRLEREPQGARVGRVVSLRCMDHPAENHVAVEHSDRLRRHIVGCSSVGWPPDMHASVVLLVAEDALQIDLQALRRVLLPTGLLLVLVFGLWIGCRFRQNCLSGDNADRACLGFVHASMVCFCGIIVTLYAASFAHRHETHHRIRDENTLLDSYEHTLRENFIAVRTLGTGALAAFMRSNPNVTAGQFADFCAQLDRFPTIAAWGWLQAVSGEALGDFAEAIIAGTDDAALVGIWTLNDDGIQAIVEPERMHYPLIHAYPDAVKNRLLGLDMASIAYRRKLIEHALTEGAVASHPLKLLHTDDLAQGLIIFEPVFGFQSPDEHIGIVIATLPLERLASLAQGIRAKMHADLFMANAEGGWQLLVSNDKQSAPLKINGEIDRYALLRPFAAFGNTYVARFKPVPQSAFSALMQAGWLTLFAGLMVTGFATWVSALLGRQRYALESAVSKRTRSLEESEVRYAALAEQSRTYTWETDLQGTFTYLNPVAEQIIGYRPDDVVGKINIFDLHPEEGRQAFKDRCISLITASGVLQNVENPIQTRNGDVIRVMTSGTVRVDEHGRVIGFRGWDVDMTAMIKARERLELMHRALDAAANPIVLTDRYGSIEWANQAFTQVSGYSLEEVVGSNPRELVKSGKQSRSFYRGMWKAITSGEVWSGELINRRKDGTLYPEEMTITPVRNESGQIHHYIAIKRDLTEEKAREAQQLRTQRLESIGTLAGGIAHDLNNALLPVNIGIDMLKQHPPGGKAWEMTLNQMKTSVERSASMIRQLLDFARGRDGQKIVFSLKHTVRELEQLIAETFPKNIELQVAIPAGIKPVLGDPTQIYQVLLNLCVNARDAMPDGGILQIQLANAEIAASGDDEPAIPAVQINVVDSGVGMSPELVERIFDPFFTTKEFGKGTGLGLPTSHAIVKGHGGTIRVHSKPGSGTRLEVYLPAASEETKETSKVVVQDRVFRGNGETILLVDDEPVVLQATADMLRRAGYIVITASDGSEALDCFKREKSIDLVVIDRMMPVMDGELAVKHMRQTKPELCVVYTSGLDMRNRLVADGTFQLAKPYSANAILAAIADLLVRD